jgi:hypothetical protein
MGSTLSIEKILQLPDEERISRNRLSKSDIKIVSQSWKEMRDFKTNRLNMMIKSV